MKLKFQATRKVAKTHYLNVGALISGVHGAGSYILHVSKICAEHRNHTHATRCVGLYLITYGATTSFDWKASATMHRGASSHHTRCGAAFHINWGAMVIFYPSSLVLIRRGDSANSLTRCKAIYPVTCGALALLNCGASAPNTRYGTSANLTCC
jgi:hypothetical protein